MGAALGTTLQENRVTMCAGRKGVPDSANYRPEKKLEVRAQVGAGGHTRVRRVARGDRVFTSRWTQSARCWGHTMSRPPRLLKEKEQRSAPGPSCTYLPLSLTGAGSGDVCVPQSAQVSSANVATDSSSQYCTCWKVVCDGLSSGVPEAPEGDSILRE